MARFNEKALSRTAPLWAGDFHDRRAILAGGAKLDEAAFPAGQPVKSGTLVGRTYAERDSGAAFGPLSTTLNTTTGVTTINDDEIYFVVYTVDFNEAEGDCELYRPESLVYENYLPDFSGYAAEVKAKVRELYHCITMQESNTTPLPA